MPVSRGRRVQVDAQIRDPAARTYEAQAVTHVGPQRRQSEASNFNRLARDLGQFNSSLGKFASGAKAYADSADREAKKLAKEREAAEKRRKAQANRKKRGKKGGKSTVAVAPDQMTLHPQNSEDEKVDVTADPGFHKRVLGEENVTAKTYKSVTEARKDLGPEFDNAARIKRASDSANNYMVTDVDDDGNEMGTRVKTMGELELEHAQIDKSIEEKYKDNPVGAKYLKNRNQWHLHDAKKALLKAEEADRVNTATEFAKGNTVSAIQQMQAAGMNPDQMAQKLQEQHIGDASVIAPNFTREQADRATLEGLSEAMDNGDIDGARAAVALLQGSPASGTGVKAYSKHPKYARASNAILRKASKILAAHDAETKASIASKEYLAAGLDGKETPFLGDIEVNVNGQKIKISAAQQKKAISTKIDNGILTEGNGEFQVQKDPKVYIPRLVEAYMRFPELTSPKLKTHLAPFTLKKGEQVDFRDPKYQNAMVAADTLLKAGPGGKTMLRKMVPDYMIKYYEMDQALQRSGMGNGEQRTQRLNVFLEHRGRGGSLRLSSSLEKSLKTWQPEGLTPGQRNMALNVVRMSVLDEDVDIGEVESRLTNIVEGIKSHNPQMNGRTYPIPANSVLPANVYQANLEEIVNERFKKATGHEGEVFVKKWGNNYVIHDAESELPVFNPKTGKPRAVSHQQIEGLSQRKAIERERQRREDIKAHGEIKAKQMADDRERTERNKKIYSKHGSLVGGFVAGYNSWFPPETVDATAEREENERNAQEQAELGTIYDANEGAIQRFEGRTR